MSCGIYKIQNLINNKIYIGQSINIEERWMAHKRLLDDCAIHLAIQKYGIKNFSFDIIELCDKQLLNEKQIYYIKKYNSLSPNGYNMTIGGSNPSLVTCKIVQQYSLKGILLCQYPSMSQASRITNITVSAISACCLNKLKQAGGFQWKIKNDEKLIQQNIDTNIHGRKILQYNLKGRYLKSYKTLKQASQSTNIAICNISQACLGKAKTAGNFQWKYCMPKQKIIKNIQPITKEQLKGCKKTIQYDKQNNFIAQYQSLTEASLQTGFSIQGISACCLGKKKTYKGFIWKYQ